jgi:hypothetical protein
MGQEAHTRHPDSQRTRVCVSGKEANPSVSSDSCKGRRGQVAEVSDRKRWNSNSATRFASRTKGEQSVSQKLLDRTYSGSPEGRKKIAQGASPGLRAITSEQAPAVMKEIQPLLLGGHLRKSASLESAGKRIHG